MSGRSACACGGFPLYWGVMEARRTRVLTVLVAAFAATLVSGTRFTGARAGAGVHKAPVLASLPGDGPHTDPRHAVETFDLMSVNTGEKLTVRYVDDRLDPELAAPLEHLMRCLRTDREMAIDPRLVEALREIARQVGKPLLLVSGFRAPERRSDHNYHTRGQAADIRVEGMRAYKLRGIARKLGIRGVGWYPTTNMIHVDVRDVPYFWTDWSGPTRWRRRKR